MKTAILQCTKCGSVGHWCPETMTKHTSCAQCKNGVAVQLNPIGLQIVAGPKPFGDFMNVVDHLVGGVSERGCCG